MSLSVFFLRKKKMFEKKKLFLSLWVLGAVVNATPVMALENDDAILVKVHNIKPIKNEKGMTTNCEFTTTIFNRSSKDASDVNIELNWFDEGAKSTIEQEKSIDTSNRRKTKDFVSADVNSSISFPMLKKNTQKSIQGNINTDRCFLLMENAKINVKSCKFAGATKKDEASCASLFQYISSKSPEYYTEFLAVTLDKHKEEDKKKQEKISNELDSIFEQIDENMKKTSRLLTTTYAQTSQSGVSSISIPEAPKKAIAIDEKDDEKKENVKEPEAK